MNRRTFIGLAAAAGGGLLGYGHWVEPRALSFSSHRIRLSTAGAQPIGADDAPGAAVRIVQMSDLHLKNIGAVHESVAGHIDELSPDLIVFTGDTLDHRQNIPLLREFLALLRTGAPKLASLGNWEYQADVSFDDVASELSRVGGELLVNRSVVLPVAGKELVVTGLDDWLRGRPHLGAALSGVTESQRASGHHLVIAHCPIQRDLLAQQLGGSAPPWLLAGHTHGGQVGVARLRVTPHGSGRYVRGWYRASTPHLYVSRGIGTSVLPLRIGSRPEVVVFDVELS